MDNIDAVPDVTQRTPLTLSSIEFSDDKIVDIIRALDPSKSSGFDLISPHMVKICDYTIVQPLRIIFESCLRHMIFPDKWKMSNVCPVHKKESKTLKENYRPISLLPIFAKIFEKMIFVTLYNYFIDNNLLTPCQ